MYKQDLALNNLQGYLIYVRKHNQLTKLSLLSGWF